MSSRCLSSTRSASSVTAYPIGGGKPTTWFSIGADQHLPGGSCDNVIAALADWWPHWGIAFWAIACGASRNLDNTPLDVLTAPGAQPRQIAQTLSHGDAPFAAAAERRARSGREPERRPHLFAREGG